MKYYCYILFSTTLQKFYTGATANSVEGRLELHLNDFYGNNKFTHSAKDWTIFLEIPCSSYKQAMDIEKHIKKMKSSKYIQNLKKYPDLILKLQERFKN